MPPARTSPSATSSPPSDPASCRVASFKEPTPEEEAHHFLWRADCLTPGHGELVIFDRSYYEQVLLPQVHDELPEAIRRRFTNINDFERLLHEHGIIVVKVFLHVSEEEQGSGWKSAKATWRRPGKSRPATGRSASSGTPTWPPMRRRSTPASARMRPGT